MTLADRLIVMNEGRVEQGVASEIKVGIRPHMEAGGSRPVRFEIAVDLVEALGADALVYGRLGDDGISLTVRLPGNTRVAARERLTLSVAIQNIHFLTPALVGAWVEPELWASLSQPSDSEAARAGAMPKTPVTGVIRDGY